MNLDGSPAEVYHALGRTPIDPWAVRRFDVRTSRCEGPRIRISDERFADSKSRWFEIGRVGVIRDHGLDRVLLVLHDAAITDELHQHIANVALRVTGGRCAEMLLDPVTALINGFSRVSVYATDNGGITWVVKNASSILSDFCVHGDGDVTVRFGSQAVRLPSDELIDVLPLDRPPVSGYGLKEVDPSKPLVHFTEAEVSDTTPDHTRFPFDIFDFCGPRSCPVADVDSRIQIQA